MEYEIRITYFNHVSGESTSKTIEGFKRRKDAVEYIRNEFERQSQHHQKHHFYNRTFLGFEYLGGNTYEISCYVDGVTVGAVSTETYEVIRRR